MTARNDTREGGIWGSGGGVGVDVNYIKNNLRTLFYVIKLR